VLVEVARRLRRTMRTTDTAYRLGGDEFVVVAEGLHPDSAEDLGARLARVVADPIGCTAGVARVGASIGVATAVGAMADAHALLATADAAMYEAKRAGRGGVVLARPRA